MIADGVQQMGFPQADPTIDKERVVGMSRLFGHCQTTGVSEAVGLPHNKGLEGVARVDPRLAAIGEGGSADFGGGGGFHDLEQ